MPKDKFLLPVNQLCLCMCVGGQEKKKWNLLPSESKLSR